MSSFDPFLEVPTTAYAEALARHHFMDYGIKPLWQPMPRLAGPAFTVQLAPNDQLMFHAAIYEAPPGSVIVAAGSGDEFAVAGGNVCAIAQSRGIAGFVIDGVIRDIGEIRAMQLPVYARGVVPVPGVKQTVSPLQTEIHCGGARVNSGDMLIADEDGIIVLPQAEQDAFLAIAKARLAKEESLSLDEWQAQHKAKIDEKLNKELLA